MESQFLNIVCLGEIVFLILVGGAFIYAIELQRESKGITKKRNDIENNFD